MNLACVLEQSAAAHGERPALLLQGEEAVTHAALRRDAEVFASRLAAFGVEPGDRVALLLPNGVAFVAAYFGALRLGAIVVPLNSLLSDPELVDRLDRSSARVLVGDEERASAFDVPVVAVRGEVAGGSMALVDRSDRDAAVLLFTSGTSGAAKGAILTHGSLRSAARNAAVALALESNDVVLGAAPFSHVLGQATGILSTFMAGAAIAVVPRFQAQAALPFMATSRTTVLLGVPTMCVMLCEAARDAEALPPLRVAHVGGAPVPLEVARAFERAFGADVREGYGLTELSGIATTYLPGEVRRAGSVGRPLDGTDLRIVTPTGEPLTANEIGEVQFRGPSVFSGYWQDDEASTAALGLDGWLATGDLGYVDADGYLFLVDRKNELIIRGGYNVYPREVEEVLYAHPDVLEVAVVGVPDGVLGEEVAAVVVLRDGATISPTALQEFAKERVAAYKYPRHVVFVDALPKGPTGKILKRELATERLLCGQAGSERR
jgi:long-chain acyl-CoA synthetase